MDDQLELHLLFSPSRAIPPDKHDAESGNLMLKNSRIMDVPANDVCHMEDTNST
jgi:hypothetical protein